MAKGWRIAAGVVLLLALGGGSAGAAAYHYAKDDRLPARFTVGGLDVGGQSASLALEQVRRRLAALENVEVSAMPPGMPGTAGEAGGDPLPALRLQRLGMTAKADEAVRAMEYYRDRDWWERLKSRVRGDRGGAYPLVVAWEEPVLEREVRAAWGSAAFRPPKDAARFITETDEVVYTPEVPGTRVDVAALIGRIKQLAPSSLADPTAGKPRTVKLPVAPVQPKVTVASLKAEGIERKIAAFTTSFAASAEGRSHNVTAAATALNDTLLQPDEVFEYGKIVAKADREYGYREAPVIVQGKLIPGVGGGICQVSSTLYNAVLLAGLDVVERRNHSLVVHYLPPGLDATYAEGYVNFRFRNSTGKQLLIRTVVRDKQLTVKLFGTLDANVTYRTETKLIKAVEPEIRYVGNNTVALGREKVLDRGAPGYVVDAYRIRLVNGREVSREQLPRSSYRAQEELVAVHPDDPRLKPQGTTPPPSGRDGPVEPM